MPEVSGIQVASGAALDAGATPAAARTGEFTFFVPGNHKYDITNNVTANSLMGMSMVPPMQPWEAGQIKPGVTPLPGGELHDADNFSCLLFAAFRSKNSNSPPILNRYH
jgi:hypothetical protein